MFAIAAILAVHNDASTLAAVLRHLASNRIDVHVINHGATDATPEILARHAPWPVVQITHEPFDGVYRWQQLLRRKEDIGQRIAADWVIHIDADEILESPREGETLREMIERLDTEGLDVIDSDEFVFIPSDESECYGDDFFEKMRHYYFHAPQGRTLHRALRIKSGAPEWSKTGGHSLDLSRRKLAPEHMRLRHYMGLSMDGLRAQYLSRVFAAEELRKGWHYNRIATTENFIVPPPRPRLWNLDRDGWRIDRPEAKHLIFYQPQPYKPPPPIPATEAFPMPFVVGVGRSGTTLLRLMMDAHPNLAMTPETHWLKDAITLLLREPASVPKLRTCLTGNTYWRDMQITNEQLENILKAHHPSRPFDTLRAIYRLYGSFFNAFRVGDKTPIHGLSMTVIAQAFPEARFIHIIRDGRDVAVSYRHMWFGPGSDSRKAASFWTWRIREMRQQAQFLPHYMEVRYEQLVTDPEPVLRRIGEFIALPFDSRQLQAHEYAAQRLTELGSVRHGDRVVDAEHRRSIFKHTLHPPSPDRIGRWQLEMTPDEVKAFECIAGNMLSELGYKPSQGS